MTYLAHGLIALAIIAGYAGLAGLSGASGQRERAAERLRQGGGGR